MVLCLVTYTFYAMFNSVVKFLEAKKLHKFALIAFRDGHQDNTVTADSRYFNICTPMTSFVKEFISHARFQMCPVQHSFSTVLHPSFSDVILSFFSSVLLDLPYILHVV